MEPERNTSWGDKKILGFLSSFTFGVLVSSFVFVPPLISLLVLLVGVAVYLAEKIYYQKVFPEIVLVSLALVSFGLGSLRYAVKDFHELETPAETGVVVSEPEGRENTRRFVYLSDNGEKVLVSGPLYTSVEYGDSIVVSGKLERPGVIGGEVGKRDFDYGAYLSRDGIYHTLSFAEVEVVESGQGHFLKSALLGVKNNFIQQVKSILAEPYASLLMGLIVSGKQALPEDILEDFRRAGVIHIVVLSGYNITLIAEFLRRALERLFIFSKISVTPQAVAGVSIVGIVLFVLMTGAQATVVRASIMAVIVIGAKLFGRSYSAPRALVFAGFLMLLENPKILVFDPSFQLSFLATLGLIYIAPVLGRKLEWVTEKWQLRETLSQTLSTQLAVLPLLVYSVGDISLVSLPANLLILLIVPVTMFVGFVSVMLSYISTIIVWPISYLAFLLLAWILSVAEILGNLPFATVAVPSVSTWLVVLIYIALVSVFIFGLRWRNLFRKNSS